MSEQHGFLIHVEVIERGDYATAYKAALDMADGIIDNNGDELAVVVEPTGHHLFQGVPQGQAFCEGCEGHMYPGVRWPTASNDDNTRSWVERCDVCERFETDEDAKARVLEMYEGSGAKIVHGVAFPVGSSQEQPYVEVG